MSKEGNFRTIIEINLTTDDNIGVLWEEGMPIPKACNYLKRTLTAFEDMMDKIEKGEMDEFGKTLSVRGTSIPG